MALIFLLDLAIIVSLGAGVLAVFVAGRRGGWRGVLIPWALLSLMVPLIARRFVGSDFDGQVVPVMAFTATSLGVPSVFFVVRSRRRRRLGWHDAVLGIALMIVSALAASILLFDSRWVVL